MRRMRRRRKLCKCRDRKTKRNRKKTKDNRWKTKQDRETNGGENEREEKSSMTDGKKEGRRYGMKE